MRCIRIFRSCSNPFASLHASIAMQDSCAAFRDTHGLWCRQQLKAEDRRLPIDIFVGKDQRDHRRQ